MWRISGGKVEFMVYDNTIGRDKPLEVPDTYHDFRQWFALQYGVDYVNYSILKQLTAAEIMLDFETNPHGFGLRPWDETQATTIEDLLVKLKLRKEMARQHFLKFIPAVGKSLFSGEPPTPSAFDDLSRATLFLRSTGNWGMPLSNIVNKHYTSHTMAMAFSIFDRMVNPAVLKDYLVNLDLKTPDETDVVSTIYVEGSSGETYAKTARAGSKKGTGVPTKLYIPMANMILKAITADLPTFTGGFNGRSIHAPGAKSTEFDVGDSINISMIMQFNHKALLAGTPTDYWRKMKSHRIVVKRHSDGAAAALGKETACSVYLYGADMRTGGITGTPMKLGTIAGSETEAKRIVLQYLPDVPVYSPGNNPNLAPELRTTYKEMNLALPELKTWLSTANMGDYKYVYVLENEWKPNERTFITARDLEIAQNYPTYYNNVKTKLITQYGKPTGELLQYLQTEAHSPTLLHYRAPEAIGTNARNQRLGPKEGMGMFASQTSVDFARWAQNSQQNKLGFNYTAFKLPTAIDMVDLPPKVKTAIFSGEGSVWKAKISVYAVSNQSYEKAADFMTRILPLKVAEILNSVGASGKMPFGSYLTTNNSSTKLGNDIPPQGLQNMLGKWGPVFDRTLKHFETQLESLFISEVKATLTPIAGAQGHSLYNYPKNTLFQQPAYYGKAYDSYIALAGAAAYLNGNAINKPGEYPLFLTPQQKLIAQGYIRSSIGTALDVTPIASFAINDSEDVQNIHSNLKEYGAFQGMNEMPVLDIPAFNIKWQRGTDGLSGSAPFEPIQLSMLNGKTTSTTVYNLPVRPYKASVYSGPSNEFGGLFHKQILGMALLYNDQKLTIGKGISTTVNVRIPLNCTGVIGGSYGMRPGGGLSLSTITSSEGSFGIPSSGFKISGPNLFRGGALVYAAILGTVMYKEIVKNRYV